MRGYDSAVIAEIERKEAVIALSRPQAEELSRLIDLTFQSIPRPEITLRVARARDDEWNVSPERALELAAEDPETDWRDVPKEKTESYQEYFTFADAKGWRFYLPAFMTHYLSEFPDYGWDAVYEACVSMARVEELTEAELKLVKKFVELCDRYEEH